MNGGSALAARLRAILGGDLAQSFQSSPVAISSLCIVATMVLAALFAPLLAPQNPFDPATLDLMEGFSRPMVANEVTGRVFWMGSDDQGRDVLSAILYGLRISLFVGFVAVFVRDGAGRWSWTACRVSRRLARCPHHARCRCPALIPVDPDCAPDLWRDTWVYRADAA